MRVLKGRVQLRVSKQHADAGQIHSVFGSNAWQRNGVASVE